MLYMMMCIRLVCGRRYANYNMGLCVIQHLWELNHYQVQKVDFGKLLE